MKDKSQPQPDSKTEARPQPEATAPATSPESNPPESTTPKSTKPENNQPVTPGNEAPASPEHHTVPELSLWELMRADMPGAPVDDSSRVLANHRPSIWDLP